VTGFEISSRGNTNSPLIIFNIFLGCGQVGGGGRGQHLIQHYVLVAAKVYVYMWPSTQREIEHLGVGGSPAGKLIYGLCVFIMCFAVAGREGWR
jgi:hypothetical protein